MRSCYLYDLDGRAGEGGAEAACGRDGKGPAEDAGGPGEGHGVRRRRNPRGNGALQEDGGGEAGGPEGGQEAEESWEARESQEKQPKTSPSNQEETINYLRIYSR